MKFIVVSLAAHRLHFADFDGPSIHRRTNFNSVLPVANRWRFVRLYYVYLIQEKTLYYQNRPLSEILRCGYEMKLYKDIGKSVTRWEVILRHLQNVIRRQILGKKGKIFSV